MIRCSFFVFACLVSCLEATLLADLPEVTQVELLVGSLLKSEGGKAAKESFPLLRPFGIDFDSQGAMYIVELEGGRVHKIVGDSGPKVISGDGSKTYSGDGGPFSEATYNGMHNIAINAADRVFIADTFNHCLREVDLSKNTIKTFSGNGKPGFAGDGALAAVAQYDYLMCATLNPAGDELYIADLKNARIRKIDLKTNFVSTVAGNGKKGIPTDGAQATASPLVDPRAVTVDHEGNIYILERGGNALRKVTPNGTIETVAGTGRQGFQDGPALTAEFASPKHLCVDKQNRVYIADDANAAIRCYDPQTKMVSTLLGRGFGDQRIRLNQPHGVTIEAGKLFVCDTSNNRVFKLSFRAQPE